MKKRPLCILCKKDEVETNGKYYRKECSSCRKLKRKQFQYRQYKKDKCEYCNFVPIHSCQLDVDHIDGNHYNNDPSNLQTLCANCHRLKTKLQE